MAKQERLGPLCMAFAIFGVLATLFRAYQLYGRSTVETVNAVVYIALSILLIFAVAREAILFLKERGISL